MVSTQHGERRVRELEDRAIEISQSEQQGEKKI